MEGDPSGDVAERDPMRQSAGQGPFPAGLIRVRTAGARFQTGFEPSTNTPSRNVKEPLNRSGGFVSSISLD